MGYKDKDAQREYQREWVAARRAEFFKGKKCKVCGSTKNLELDHRDPKQKVSHRIFSWSWDRIHAEAAKCDILCKTHHDEKTIANRDKTGRAKLTMAQAEEIRKAYATGDVTQKQLAAQYRVDQTQISSIVRGKSYK